MQSFTAVSVCSENKTTMGAGTGSRFWQPFSLLCVLLVMALPLHADTVRLATDETLDQSGLLTVLNDAFEQQTGIKVDVTLSGSGRALMLAEEGEVDVLLVSNPGMEEEFLASTQAADRQPVMYSDFVVIGSQSDPSRIAELDTAGMILRRITLTQMPFVSQGDGSVTYQKELELWTASRLQPSGRRYMVAGSNLRRLFEMAQHYQAYTLLERRDYLTYKDRTNLHLLYENDPLLYLPYHVIAVSADKHPDVNSEQAQAYVEFLTGPEGQSLIEEFRLRDEPVFFPGSPPDA
jgi:tungstate transport system substrate-binding protein